LNPIEETEGILQLLSLRLNQDTDNVVSLLYRMQNEAKGEIEYTKATAIARVKDLAQRTALLEATIADSLSLTQINERIKASRQVNPEPPSLKNRYKEASSQLQKAKIWENPKKQKALEKLLAQIEALLVEE
jgi:ParB family chromosome partitioning protein